MEASLVVSRLPLFVPESSSGSSAVNFLNIHVQKQLDTCTWYVWYNPAVTAMSCSSCNVILLHRINQKKSTKMPLPLYGLVQCHEDTPRVFLPVMRREDFTYLHHANHAGGSPSSSQQRISLRTTTLYSRKIPRSSFQCIAMCEQKLATRLFRSFRCRGPWQSHLINLISLAAYPIPSWLRDLLGIVGRSCLTQRYSGIKGSYSFISLSYFFCIVRVSGRLRRHIP